MELAPYVDQLQHELLLSAETGDDEARILAERLVGALTSATRLVLLEALAAAAAEITADLAPGSVEVRLRGREPEFVVRTPVVESADNAPRTGPDPAAGPAARVVEADEGGTSRITLRLPEPLKLRIEEAAGENGFSVNAWLVRTLTGVLEPTGRGVHHSPRSPMGGDRFTGWARS